MRIFLMLLVPVLFFSCQETIDWDVKESQQRLVVEGMITTELKKHEVNLTLAGNYYDSAPAAGVSGAKVVISDGTTAIDLVEVPFSPGRYETPSEIQGEVGKTYTLDIELKEEINEQRHYTASSTIQRLFPTESIVSYIKETELEDDDKDKYLLIFILGKEPKAQGDHYMIKLSKNSTPLTDTITNSIFINDDAWEIDGLSGMITWYNFRDNSIAIKDTLSVEVYSVNKEYEKYIQDLEASTTEPDPFGMSGPPANLKGNISGGALGFFLASSVSKDTCIITPYNEDEADFLKKSIEKKW